MKTTLDIVDMLWTRANNSALKTGPSEINGSICRHRRDPNSDKEDIVINCLPINNEQLSRAVANFNIHVPDITVAFNSSQDKQPNHDRLKELAGMAVVILNDVWPAGENLNYSVQQQVLFRDAEAGDHYINIRIEFNIINL